MLIQNIDVNALKKNEKETSHDKGWGIMEQGAIALVVIIVLALVFGGLYMLRSRTGVANESSNIQTIITSTQGLRIYVYQWSQNDGCSHSDGWRTQDHDSAWYSIIRYSNAL